MYFNLKKPMMIGGKKFRTCICYDLTETLRFTVEKLAAEGKAEIYPEVRFFCRGRRVKTASEKAAEKRAAKKAERKAKKEAEERAAPEALSEPSVDSF